MGQAVPQPDAGPERPRDPSALGGGGLRPRDRGGGGGASRQGREGHQVGRPLEAHSPKSKRDRSPEAGRVSIAPPGIEPGLS